ncbi:WhiB family transcriptional regulator [Mycolicibacterium sp. S2-37]|uniref:WhiB family transcriptional regulator n=1 Tax=Mycolicibacterium sp. S2-37 TaxID=2810297 RepID=UPI001A94DF74|nr:WhiB family transcriptional regulator [Mycolicibacterium sp. S2-37]MBO0676886.1 WhiB family transcriptional regulator [Mycolicibacterium sp. S2-37]
MDPEIFTSGSRSCRAAKKVCMSCPVRAECLKEALEFEAEPGSVRHGVWGGLTAHERTQLFGEPGGVAAHDDDRCAETHAS